MTEGLPLLSLDLNPGFSTRTGKPKPGAVAFAFAQPASCGHPGYQQIGGGPFQSPPFPLLKGKSAPPLSSHEKALQSIGSEEDQYTEQYNACDACTRVLFHNPPTGDAARRARVTAMRIKNSLIGVNGHLERTNSWIHLIGALLFGIFAAIRSPVGLDVTSTSGVLSGITSAVIMVTFLVSTAYHTLGTIGDIMPFLRMLDHGAIYVALSVATVTDTAVVTMDFLNAPWQTVVDAIGVAAVLLVFFSYRRLVLPPSETIVAWGSCKLGLFRLQHADKDHSALRSSGYVILSFGFISLLPAAVHNLPYEMAAVLIACNGTSLLLLIAGLLLDNVLVWPDTLYEKGTLPSGICNSKKYGCLCNSHAIWHALSLFSVFLLTLGREIVITNTLPGRFGSPEWKGGDAMWTLFEP